MARIPDRHLSTMPVLVPRQSLGLLILHQDVSEPISCVVVGAGGGDFRRDPLSKFSRATYH